MDEPPLTQVLLMAEHGGVWLWDESPGQPTRGGLSPAALGLPADLVDRLDDWNRRYEERTSRWGWGPPPPDQAQAHAAEEQAWTDEGLQLAHALQRAVDGRDPAVTVSYATDGEGNASGGRRQPVRERRGR